jgi:hypothetical protein
MPLLTTGTLTQARSLWTSQLYQVGNVYTRGLAGRMDLLVRAALPIRLTHLTPGSNSGAEQRDQLLMRRRLLWALDYYMPDPSEVEIDGKRWRTVTGTFVTVVAEDGGPVERAVDVIWQNR